jgi:hypothetical protein
MLGPLDKLSHINNRVERRARERVHTETINRIPMTLNRVRSNAGLGVIKSLNPTAAAPPGRLWTAR